jgi:hypothetical protein
MLAVPLNTLTASADTVTSPVIEPDPEKIPFELAVTFVLDVILAAQKYIMYASDTTVAVALMSALDV